MIHQVQISRIIKNSPYNIAAWLDDVVCDSADKVISLPKVQQVVNQTYGKTLKVYVYTDGESYVYAYQINKNSAIIR
jgi:hypothetical protein